MTKEAGEPTTSESEGSGVYLTLSALRSTPFLASVSLLARVQPLVDLIITFPAFPLSSACHSLAPYILRHSFLMACGWDNERLTRDKDRLKDFYLLSIIYFPIYRRSCCPVCRGLRKGYERGKEPTQGAD